MSSSRSPFITPSSILIIGTGVFGLSTAHALSQRPQFSSTKITLIDRSPFPAQDGSSIDTSRIIRADYRDPLYAGLAAQAQTKWRAGYGGTGTYEESGLVLVADKGADAVCYVEASYENNREINKDKEVKKLRTRSEIVQAVGTGSTGDSGYLNLRSGWADAEAAMLWLYEEVKKTERVEFVTAEAVRLLKYSNRVRGAILKNGTSIKADLTILSTGAWTPKFVNLQGRAQATGQVLCYLQLSEEEQQNLGKMPVTLNMSTGLFIIPPRQRLLKIGRHAYGLSNPTTIPNPDNPSEIITVSLPKTAVDQSNLWVPAEGEDACRNLVRELIPKLGDRKFTQSRICWYTDTPNGDFLIDYHPDMDGLFLATGGSGHAFKFLPVIGSHIVDLIEGKARDMDLAQRWKWPKIKVQEFVTEDGSRGGRRGLILAEELARSKVSKL